MANGSNGMFEQGVFRKGQTRIADRCGERGISLGDSSFASLVARSVFVDKSLLIRDVVNSRSKVTLFCRPRRFGKSLALSMMREYLELPTDRRGKGGAADAPNPTDPFRGLAIDKVDDGAFRKRHREAYPVVFLSLASAKSSSWETARNLIALLVAEEFGRHGYLLDSDALDDDEKAYCRRIKSRQADDADLIMSLRTLTTLLRRHHERPAVVLIDEYDAPVMAGYTNGYYESVVDFMRGWLTGALKDNGEALAFACLTGVQRIAKESIFSDLNNLVVNTPLDTPYDERFGFTQDDVAALATYLGHEDKTEELRSWYDGYRFGNADIYNPWSVLSYFCNGCRPEPYWSNTSSNSVVRDLVLHADAVTTSQLYNLLDKGGTVRSTLDLGVAFSDLETRSDAIWSMLYLSGYLTTCDSARDRAENPECGLDLGIPRYLLRLPNREVELLFRREVLERSALMSGSLESLGRFQDALTCGDTDTVRTELERILANSTSFFDLTSENSYHMLVMGLCFSMPGYDNPTSNREAGEGRYDIQIRPQTTCSPGQRGTHRELPVVTIEIKMLDRARARAAHVEPDVRAATLAVLAQDAVDQIAQREYDCGFAQRVRWGFAFSGKHAAVACRTA